MSGKLYIIATPIGNLEDMGKRAVDVLKSTDLILTEDTRVTKKLLDAYGIDTPVSSYHAHSSPNKREAVLARLLEGQSLALVTDAGTPGISDPGNELADYLYENANPQIIPIPGPSALTTALSASGFNVSAFTFIGFMPKKKRLKLVTNLHKAKRPFVYFDSPHRVIKNLELVEEICGPVRVFVARELTKMHEEHYRGQVEDVLATLKKQKKVKGEVVVVVENSVSPGRIELPSKV